MLMRGMLEWIYIPLMKWKLLLVRQALYTLESRSNYLKEPKLKYALAVV